MEGLGDAARNVEYKGLKSFIDRLNSDNINLLFYYYGQTTPLIFAIGRYDSRQTTVESFNVMIKPILDIKGIDVNEANTNGETALMVAVRENLLTITKMLLEKGADVNMQDEGGMTALMKVRNNVDMVNALIENKAEIKEMDNDGNTALSHYVANSVFIDQITTLIEKDADVNAGCYNLKYLYDGTYPSKSEYSSSTPLMNVIVNYTGDTKSTTGLMKLMLSKGADVNLFDSEGKTAIDYCFKRKDWKDLLDVILNYTKPDKIERKQYNQYSVYNDYNKLLYLYEQNIIPYDEDEFKSLICSSPDRHVEDQKAKVRLLEKMLDLGIEKFLVKTQQEKPEDDIIVCAAILGKSDKVEQLLKDGANVNVGFFYQNFRTDVNYNYSTALMCAAEKGNKEIVGILLENKADVDVVQGANGRTALYYAIKSENIKLVELLGKKLAKPDKGLLMTVVKMFHRDSDYNFRTSLDFPLVKFVEIILNIKGVDVNFENSEGKTPLMYLVKENDLLDEERIEAISKTANKIINFKGVNVNLQDKDGKTALMYFIEENPKDTKNNYNDIISDILKIKGVDVNLQDKDGKTALFYAVIKNNSTITTAILKDANANAKDKDGKTALFYAKDRNIVGLLLSSKKISVDEKDNSGKTALFYAPPKLIAPLVKGGANVNMQDNLGKTALFYTYTKNKGERFDEKNMAEKVKKLLDNRADVTIVDNEGKTVIKAIIEKLGDDSSELGVLMEILKIVPDLNLSYKNQKGYNVITYLFLIKSDTKMIRQVLEYCSENMVENQLLFNHVYEVEYYITYIKNEMEKKKKKKENTEEFEKIIKLLEEWKTHVSLIPGSEEVGKAARRFSEIALDSQNSLINYPLSKKQQTNKFGGRLRRRSTLRVPLAVSRPAKRRSYIKNKSLAKPAPSLRSGRRRSKRKTTVRYSRIRKYP